MKLLFKWILSGLALWIVSRILPGFVVTDFGAALIAVIIIGLVNALIKPIFTLLTLPINILTLGIFSLVINALMLLLASNITPGFQIDGFGTALVGSIFLTILTTLLHSAV